MKNNFLKGIFKKSSASTMADTSKSAVKSTASILSDSERRMLLSRVGGYLGMSDASKLPYMKSLILSGTHCCGCR